MKVNQESQPGEGTVWFDYFLAIDPRIQSNSTTTTTKSKNTGAIVGSVIGGIIFFLIVVFLALVGLRRRKKRRLERVVQPWTDKEVQSAVLFRTSFLKAVFYFFLQFKLKTFGTRREIASTHPTVVPFRETGPAPASTHKPTLSTAFSSTPPSSTRNPPMNNAIMLNPASTRKRQGDLTAPACSNALPGPAVQHVDSGVRVANLDPIQLSCARVELPPVYSPV